MFATRKELIERFTDLLSGNFEGYVEESVTRTGWLKTQLLEIDSNHNSDTQSLHSLFENFANETDVFEFMELSDDSFFGLRNRSGEADKDIYVDGLDNRFVVLYTFMHSKDFDENVELMVKKRYFDRAWLPQDFMSSLDSLGAFKGYGGRFNNEYFVASPDVTLDDNPQYRNLSFKSWGKTKRLLELIQNDTEMKNQFALTNMRLKAAYDVHDDTDTIIDDITFSGRITSLGRSFRAHRDVVMRIKDAYRQVVVDEIEGKFSIHYSDNSLQGSKLQFKFTEPIENVQDFSQKLFSGKKPFRL